MVDRCCWRILFVLDADGQGDIAVGAKCPFLGQEAWVASDGRFNPCCAPDALRRTLGDFGNLSQTSLYTIWSGDAYQDFAYQLHGELPLPRLQHAEARRRVTASPMASHAISQDQGRWTLYCEPKEVRGLS